MRRKREFLFLFAAVGAILALSGLVAIIWAWAYPSGLIEDLGAAVVPEDLQRGLRVQHLGTLVGGLAFVLGLGLAVLCFRALDRDLDRLRRDRE